jgi:nucleoid-associated protein YgaU
MRNLALFTGSALVLSFTLASAAEDKVAQGPPPPAPAAAASTPTAAPAPSGPTDLATPEPAAPAASTNSIDDLEKQLSDNQEKLTTALHSYELLNEENQRLKSDSDKYAGDKAALEAQVEELKKSVAFYQAQTAIVGQVDSLRTQLRQTQDEVAALAAQNSDFRARLALAGPPPETAIGLPTRPGAAAPRLSPAPAPLPPAEPAAAVPVPAKTAPRIHVVVAGDSLTKISKEYYGTASRYGEILGANRGVIHDENILPLGAKLTIP